jgi:superfamily I DNA and/or RNA helicase
VICSTCVSSGIDLLHKIEFPFVVIDECCQSLEPGCLIPIMKGSKKIILAGDPFQLDPTVLNQDSIKEGLSKTLFSRLMENGIPTYLLTQQYRMHPKICEFPSKEFYDGKLLTDKSLGGINPRCLNWPNKNIPIMFINVKSNEMDVNNSKINKKQMDVTVDVLKKILRSYPPEDVGIISPYKSQVKLINKNIEFAKEVEVKSVDGFQGREKNFIIFSTVRSNKHGNIGFLSDWKRLNVAITRCKIGLIVIGDEQTLAHDKVWKNYLRWLDANQLIVDC